MEQHQNKQSCRICRVQARFCRKNNGAGGKDKLKEKTRKKIPRDCRGNQRKETQFRKFKRVLSGQK